jgi:hypothetical protein
MLQYSRAPPLLPEPFAEGSLDDLGTGTAQKKKRSTPGELGDEAPSALDKGGASGVGELVPAEPLGWYSRAPPLLPEPFAEGSLDDLGTGTAQKKKRFWRRTV